MKKAIIALAVAAGSIAAAQAAGTTTLYGSIGYTTTLADTSIDNSKGILDNTTGAIEDTLKAIRDNHWSINQERARLGVRGTEDLGNGLQAEFKFEVQNSGGTAGLDKTNDIYVGLKGDSWGTVRLGRQGSTYNVDENYFRSSKPAAELGWTPGSSDRTLKYISPNFSGFTVEGRINADSAKFDSLGIDQWDTSVKYEANGLSASASYGVAYKGELDKVASARNNAIRIIDRGSKEAMGVQVGYENDQFAAFGNVQHESSANTVYNVQGKYKLPDSEIRAGLGYTDVRNSSTDLYAVGVGYQYNLSKRTSAWVEGKYADATKGNVDGDFSASVGIRHDF